MNRQDDLSVVFDKMWKANHSDDVKKMREKEKDFTDKMFNTNRHVKNTISNKPDDMVNNLNKNINNAAYGMKQGNMNRIVGKFK